MTEITPISSIMPSPVVTIISKIRRDDARKKKPQPEKIKADQPESDEKPIPHIDELV